MLHYLSPPGSAKCTLFSLPALPLPQVPPLARRPDNLVPHLLADIGVNENFHFKSLLSFKDFYNTNVFIF